MIEISTIQRNTLRETGGSGHTRQVFTSADSAPGVADGQTAWTTVEKSGLICLQWRGANSGHCDTDALATALEACFAACPRCPQIGVEAPAEMGDALLQTGLVVRSADQHLLAYADMFWQQPSRWLTAPVATPFPLHYVMSNGRRHPLRPAKPQGEVYARHIPWLDHSLLTFRTIDIDADLNAFNRWMNDPFVANFWQEEGDPAKHRAYLQALADDPRVLTLMVCLDGQAFGYFEVYWAKEDRIAPFYDVDDFDRGWHVLIGEPVFRGKPFVTAWLPSLSHYLFLDDCRTRRLVIEPRSDNQRMIRSLDHCGYARIKEFDFPHKRAMLGMLLRERFFGEQLWLPQPDSAAFRI